VARSAGGGTRNELVDALKFFAVALVPLQHLLNLRSEFSHLAGARRAVEFIVSFDMPLFVFLSGFVLFGREGSDPRVFLKRRAFSLLVPYFAWVSVEMLRLRVPVAKWPETLGWAAIQPHRSYQMWFLWVLFALFVVFTLIRMVSRADVALVTVGLAAEAARFLPTIKTAGLDKIFLLMPYLVLGYLCAKHREAIRRHERLVASVGVAAFAGLSIFPYTTVPGQLVTAVAGIASAWALYRLLPESWVVFQARMGRRSLGIYASQMVTMPYVLVGTGWLGVALSQLTTTVSSVLLARALELTAFTRAVFLGQPRKPFRVPQ
jgi:fucose 4-O-acetylase-like acetyltransferase